MDFFIDALTSIFIFVVLAQTFNFLYGYTRIVFLCLVGLVAVGAYVGGLLNLLAQGKLNAPETPFIDFLTFLGSNIWLTLLTALVFTALLGFVISFPLLRFRGDFLAIVTLGFGEILRSIILNWGTVTRGSLGLPGIKRPEVFGMSIDGSLGFLLFTAVISIFFLALLYRLTHSPFGKILETIREDDIAAHTIGKKINNYRIQVIVIASGIVGVMGALNVFFIRFTEPTSYNLEYLGLILLAVFAGGPGKYWGAIIAGALVAIIRYMLVLVDFIPDVVVGPLQWVILGTVLVGILIYKPNGLFGRTLTRKNY